MKEIWKDIEGYEGLYQVSNLGRVHSNIKNKIMKQSKVGSGYLTVQLFKNKIGKRLLVHRLVATTFIPNYENLPQINHKDENKQNNCVDNLEWCTAKYNMNYGNGARTRHKKIDYTKESYKVTARQNGRKVSKAVLQIREGKIIARYDSAKQASIITHSNHSHICECCNGKRYKTVNGFEWRYERSDDLLEFQF